MPNHLHGILILLDPIDNSFANIVRLTPVPGISSDPPSKPIGPKSESLGTILGQFKSHVTRRIRRHTSEPEIPIWQRNYYEHIIRSEEELNRIRNYIAENPSNWHTDTENPASTAPSP
jgi:REP element-mobilizing transposase RayT